MECLRPGGLDITEHALSFCNFKAGARVLDVGCGKGATVSYLVKKHSLEAIGVDIAAHQSAGPTDASIRIAPAECLPFADGYFDGVMYECSLSVLNDRRAAISEAYRVLKPNGYLVVSDMYARGKSARLSGMLGLVQSRREIEQFISDNGFSILEFQDHTKALLSMLGRLVFEHGSQWLHDSVGASCDELKAIKCGYFLLVAQKRS